MIFDALSNAAYRVSLRGPGAEIERGLNTPPPQQVVENLEPSRARVKGNCSTSQHVIFFSEIAVL